MVMTKRLNIRRYEQIITVFAKHGFGLLIDQLGIFNYLKIKKKNISIDDKAAKSMISTGRRLRMACEELGPTFIKLGQILSTRTDILSADITTEIVKLQDSVHTFPFDEVRTIVESELEDKLEKIFMEFDEKPIAAASISQVHFARLNSGKQVAVKVQRPDIEKSINTDLNILKDLAHFIDNHTKYGKLYDFSSMAQDFENTLKNELDFTKEGENAETFKENFLKDDGVTVPKIKWIYTTKHVLTMEYIEGIKLDDYNALEKAGIDRKDLAKKLVTSICNQILRDGFFHADPHLGNIKILPDGTIVFIDLGMVGILSKRRKEILSNFFIGVISQNSKMVIKSLLDLDTSAKITNLRKFEKDIDEIIEMYLTLPWDKIKIEDLFNNIFNIAYLNHIKIPREFALISKTLATLQCLIEDLAPDLNTLVVAKPIAKKLLHQSFSVDKISSDIKKSLWSYKELLLEFPSALLNFLNKMEDENFTMHLKIDDADNIQRRLERSLNRMSFSVILLAVSIIIAGIIVGSSLSTAEGKEIYLINITVLKAGLLLAVIIIIGLIISMFKSKR